MSNFRNGARIPPSVGGNACAPCAAAPVVPTGPGRSYVSLRECATLDNCPSNNGCARRGPAGATGERGDSDIVGTFRSIIPGFYNVPVPPFAASALIDMAAGGGGGGGTGGQGDPSGGGGGGGAGGAFQNVPLTVAPGQFLLVLIGAGGPAGGSNGQNTTLTSGNANVVLTAFGGIGGNVFGGGNGGSATSMGVVFAVPDPPPGLGGADRGFNGGAATVSGVIASGAGGGGPNDAGNPGGRGGAAGTFSGGTGGPPALPAQENGGGGGASIFANGGSASQSVQGSPTPGMLGSGGGGANFNPLTIAGPARGGDGFVNIVFFSN